MLYVFHLDLSFGDIRMSYSDKATQRTFRYQVSQKSDELFVNGLCLKVLGILSINDDNTNNYCF